MSLKGFIGMWNGEAGVGGWGMKVLHCGHRGHFSTDGGLCMQIDSTSKQIRYSSSIDCDG